MEACSIFSCRKTGLSLALENTQKLQWTVNKICQNWKKPTNPVPKSAAADKNKAKRRIRNPTRFFQSYQIQATTMVFKQAATSTPTVPTQCWLRVRTHYQLLKPSAFRTATHSFRRHPSPLSSPRARPRPRRKRIKYTASSKANMFLSRASRPCQTQRACPPSMPLTRDSSEKSRR